MKSTAAPEKGGPHVNRDIRAVQVQLIDAEGKNRGVVEIAEAQQPGGGGGARSGRDRPQRHARRCARSSTSASSASSSRRSLPSSASAKRSSRSRRSSCRPGIDDHDYEVKMRSVKRFFEDGDKVKVTLRFRGREMAHQDIGFKLLQRVTDRDRADRQGRSRAVDRRPADDDGAGAEVRRPVITKRRTVPRTPWRRGPRRLMSARPWPTR